MGAGEIPARVQIGTHGNENGTRGKLGARSVSRTGRATDLTL
jgi:hypothetical protein